MPDSTAATTSITVSDSAMLPAFITPRIISITAENLPEKSSALATALVGEPCLRESRLHEGGQLRSDSGSGARATRC